MTSSTSLRRLLGRAALATSLGVLLAMVPSTGCGGGTASDPAAGDDASAGSDAKGRVPRVHRAASATCDDQRDSPPVETSDAGSATDQCHAHADCTAGKNGRCLANGRTNVHTCSYDACSSDVDCTKGACECGAGVGANYCAAGGCKVDGDCLGGKGYCSPSLGECGHYAGGSSGYFCHADADECVDDDDCAGFDGGGGGYAPTCRYVDSIGHWKCSTSECAG